MHGKNYCTIGPGMHHGMHHERQMGHGPCGCGCHGRMFLTKEEKIEKLEKYKEILERELEGVTEAIEELKK